MQLAYTTTNRSLAVILSMLGLILLPISQVNAVAITDEAVPVILPSQTSTESEPVNIESPIVQLHQTTTGNEVLPVQSTPVVNEPSPKEEVVVNVPLLDIIPQITSPMSVDVVMLPQTSVTTPITPTQSTTSLSTIARTQPAADVTLARARFVTGSGLQNKVPKVLLATTADSVGPVSRDFLVNPRQSGVEYTSNQISPEEAEKYYYSALGLSGAGVLLYGLSLTQRTRLFGSSLTPELTVR